MTDRSDTREVQVKFRLSQERRHTLRELAKSAGVSEQEYIEAKVLGLGFDQVQATGRRVGLKQASLFVDSGATSGRGEPEEGYPLTG